MLSETDARIGAAVSYARRRWQAGLSAHRLHAPRPPPERLLASPTHSAFAPARQRLKGSQKVLSSKISAFGSEPFSLALERQRFYGVVDVQESHYVQVAIPVFDDQVSIQIHPLSQSGEILRAHPALDHVHVGLDRHLGEVRPADIITIERDAHVDLTAQTEAGSDPHPER